MPKLCLGGRVRAILADPLGIAGLVIGGKNPEREERESLSVERWRLGSS